MERRMRNGGGFSGMFVEEKKSSSGLVRDDRCFSRYSLA